MNNDYVLKHDFGYGREEELEELFRLRLRNVEDLKVYVLDIINNAFVCSAGKKVFLIDTAKVEEVQINLIEE